MGIIGEIYYAEENEKFIVAFFKAYVPYECRGARGGGGLFTFLQDLEIWKKYNVNKGLGIIGVIYYTEKKEKKLLGCF